MAHEMITFSSRHIALTHLQIEIVFRALIKVLKTQGSDDFAVVAKAWEEGLRHIDTGLVQIELDHFFSGSQGAEELKRLLNEANDLLSNSGEDFYASDLNKLLGTALAPESAYVKRDAVDRGFAALFNLVQ